MEETENRKAKTRKTCSQCSQVGPDPRGRKDFFYCKLWKHRHYKSIQNSLTCKYCDVHSQRMLLFLLKFHIRVKRVFLFLFEVGEKTIFRLAGGKRDD